MDRVALITGVNGFTGGYVARALRARGWTIRGLTREGEADFVADLLDAARVRDVLAACRPSLVVHLAAVSFVGHADVDGMYRANVVGTRNLLEAAAAMPVVPKVLLASSANVYGTAEGELDENRPFAPQNDYAVSKVAMEYMARLWAGRVPLTLVRPFNYTGVGQSERFLIPKIVAHFRRREPVIELGNLDVWRDFNDVRRVAESFARLADAEADGEVFNLCSGNEYSLREVIAMMESISGHRVEIRVNPEFVRDNEVRHLRGTESKLRTRIDAVPAIPFDQTLRWMYEA